MPRPRIQRIGLRSRCAPACPIGCRNFIGHHRVAFGVKAEVDQELFELLETPRTRWPNTAQTHLQTIRDFFVARLARLQKKGGKQFLALTTKLLERPPHQVLLLPDLELILGWRSNIGDLRI